MAVEEEVVSLYRRASPYITGCKTSLLHIIEVTKLMRQEENEKQVKLQLIVIVKVKQEMPKGR